MDDLASVVRELEPGPGRRIGVLLDHLVEGSKETRSAREARHPHVLVTGTPFVDVWAAVRPTVAGFEAWPEVPRGIPWKEGVLHSSEERRVGKEGVRTCSSRWWASY